MKHTKLPTTPRPYTPTWSAPFKPKYWLRPQLLRFGFEWEGSCVRGAVPDGATHAAAKRFIESAGGSVAIWKLDPNVLRFDNLGGRGWLSATSLGEVEIREKPDKVTVLVRASFVPLLLFWLFIPAVVAIASPAGWVIVKLCLIIMAINAVIAIGGMFRVVRAALLVQHDAGPKT